MRLKNQLSQIGLSDTESGLYLASLTRGPATMLALSRLTKLNRPLVQKTLVGLIEKGVFRTTISGKHRLFVAVPPRQLLDFIRLRESALKGLLPELEALSSIGTKEPRILYFEGRQQVQELLKTQHTSQSKQIYAYFPSKYMIQLFGKHELEEVIQERIKKKIRVKILRPQHAEQEYEGWQLRDQALREVRHIPEDKALEMGLIIFDNKVNLFSPIDENFGIQIESHAYSSLMKYFFEMLWGISKT
jgi:sugar-specific transcriptional regulator TrmB